MRRDLTELRLLESLWVAACLFPWWATGCDKHRLRSPTIMSLWARWLAVVLEQACSSEFIWLVNCSLGIETNLGPHFASCIRFHYWDDVRTAQCCLMWWIKGELCNIQTCVSEKGWFIFGIPELHFNSIWIWITATNQQTIQTTVKWVTGTKGQTANRCGKFARIDFTFWDWVRTPLVHNGGTSLILQRIRIWQNVKIVLITFFERQS